MSSIDTLFDLQAGARPKVVRSRGWCFTLNNYTNEDKLRLASIGADTIPLPSYICYGAEVGESGTPHLQGFIYFKNPTVFGTAKRVLGDRVHLEKQKGDSATAIAYCFKGSQSHAEWQDLGVEGPNYGANKEVYFWGKSPMSQKEKGEAEVAAYEDARACAKEGKLDDIRADIFVRHYNTLLRIRDDYQIVPSALNVDPSEMNLWIVGPAGIGKSRYVRHYFPQLYDKPLSKWVCVDARYAKEWLLDDFDLSTDWMGNLVKRWADRYPFPVEVKGGIFNARPERILVTSQYTIPQIWSEDLPLVQALLRRFRIVHLETPWAPPPENASDPYHYSLIAVRESLMYSNVVSSFNVIS